MCHSRDHFDAAVISERDMFDELATKSEHVRGIHLLPLLIWETLSYQGNGRMEPEKTFILKCNQPPPLFKCLTCSLSC